MNFATVINQILAINSYLNPIINFKHQMHFQIIFIIQLSKALKFVIL